MTMANITLLPNECCSPLTELTMLCICLGSIIATAQACPSNENSSIFYSIWTNSQKFTEGSILISPYSVLYVYFLPIYNKCFPLRFYIPCNFVCKINDIYIYIYVPIHLTVSAYMRDTAAADPPCGSVYM